MSLFCGSCDIAGKDFDTLDNKGLEEALQDDSYKRNEMDVDDAYLKKLQSSTMLSSML